MKQGELTLYYRSRTDCRNKTVFIEGNGELLKKKKYQRMLPSEMETQKIVPEKELRELRIRTEG